MRYIVITKDPETGKKETFYTNWYGDELVPDDDCMIAVIDKVNNLVTYDNEHWEEIEEDNL